MMESKLNPEMYGNRRVAQLYSEWNDLRQIIRNEGSPEMQAALDKVEEHIDFAYQQNAGLPTHALRAHHVGARVKQLAWGYSYGVLRAETPFGAYKVAGRILHRPGYPAAQSVHESEDAAQTAAQADYEARIRTALEGGE